MRPFVSVAAPEALQVPVPGAEVRSRGLWLALACALPLLVSAPTVGDPFVIAEDASNAAIWGLGAKNLLTLGWSEALRGARVAPDPGTMGNGVYAHHPPLAVWLMTVPVLLGGWEGFPRLLALLCCAATLALLFRMLRRFFDDDVALAAVAAVAACGFCLHSARMLTTLTLAAPLFVALLDAGLTWRATGKLPWWATPLAALLMLSAWDGFIGAAALLVAGYKSSGYKSSDGSSHAAGYKSSDGSSRRALLAPLGAATAAALFVGWHLVDATGGTSELAWQASWRSSGVSLADWAGYQATALLPRLGPLTLAALVLAPLLLRRSAPAGALATMAVLAAPGVLMLLVFRQGAFKHPFWGYQLLLPAAFALALVLSKLTGNARRAALVALALQGSALVVWTVRTLDEEHRASTAAKMVARHFSGSREVPMFTPGGFHPWIPWNTGATNLKVSSLEELKKLSPERLLVADAKLLAKLSCAPPAAREASADGRWLVSTATEVLRACAP